MYCLPGTHTLLHHLKLKLKMYYYSHFTKKKKKNQTKILEKPGSHSLSFNLNYT